MPALRTRDTRSNALELVLDPSSSTSKPPPLSISIISPTPRTPAFSFPVTHNLSDSPFSSPSNSPFEPDLRSLDLSNLDGSGSDDEPPAPPPAPMATFTSTFSALPPPAPLPLSSFTRTLSPLPLTIPPPSTSASKRKGSASAASPGERRPKKGDDDYVKRPENAFILFRRQACAERDAVSAPASLVDAPSSSAAGKKARQADLSKTISAQWRALPAEERAKWEALAKEKKREHAEKYPGYVYRPQRKGSAPTVPPEGTFVNTMPTSPAVKRRKMSATTTTTTTTTTDMPQPVEFVLPAPRPRSQSHDPGARRSPMPYQSVQIPNVYSSNQPSLFVPPVSPDDQNMSLLPMIAQSSQSRSDSGFDYLPSFGSALEFEASYQASDFLKAMFPPSSASLSMPPLSLSSSSSGESPASSTPSSPYTPAASVVSHYVSSAQTATPTPGALLDAAYSNDINYSSESSALSQPWTTSDPWTAYGGFSASANAGNEAMDFDFDFDLANIPSVGGAWATAAPDNGAVEGGEPLPVASFGMGEGVKGFDMSMSMDFGMHLPLGDDASFEGWNGSGWTSTTENL